MSATHPDHLRNYQTDVANGFSIGLKWAVAVLTFLVVVSVGVNAWNGFYTAVFK